MSSTLNTKPKPKPKTSHSRTTTRSQFQSQFRFYSHPNPQDAILPLLRTHLPQSISVYRRLQSHIHNPQPTAHVIASFPPKPDSSYSSSSSCLPDPESRLGLDADSSSTSSSSRTCPGTTAAGATATATAPAESARGSSEPWLVLHVDLARDTETQAWLYSSLERSVRSGFDYYFCRRKFPSIMGDWDAGIGGVDITTTGMNGIDTTFQDDDDDNKNNDKGNEEENFQETTVRHQLLALFSHLRRTIFPPDPDSDSDSATSLSLPSSPKTIFFGTMHTRLRSLIPSAAVNRTSEVYAKYVFPPSAYMPRPLLPPPPPPPPSPPAESASREEIQTAAGYRYVFGEGRKIPVQHLELVLSRTHISRTVKTLAMLDSVAVYCTPSRGGGDDDDDGDGDDGVADRTVKGCGVKKQRQEREEKEIEEVPISWAFLGLDASLSSLHVEPEHRGKGLAVEVARKMYREGLLAGGMFGKEGTALKVEHNVAHSDVALDNTRSRRVMEKIGGVPLWTSVWTVLDLDKLHQMS